MSIDVKIETVSSEKVPPTEATSTRVVKNSMIYMTGQLLSWVVAFVSISIIPRSLGEKGIGQMGVAATAVVTVTLLLTLNIEQYLTPAVAREPERARELLGATIGLRMAMLPLLLIAGCLALFVMHASRTVWILGGIYEVGQVVTFFYLPCRYLLIGFEEARKVTLCDLGQVCSVLFTLPFLRFGVVPCVIVSTISSLPIMLWCIWTVWQRVGGLWPTFNRVLWQQIIRASLAFMVNEWVSPVLLFTTVFLLKQYGGGEESVGVYNQAQKLLGTFLFIPTAIGSALLPSLTRLAESDYAGFRRLQQRMTVLLIAAGMPILVFALMLADGFCHLLYGADKFQSLPITLSFCGLTVIPLYVTIILYRFLVAERKNAIWGYFMLFTLVLNGVLSRLLIPYMMHAPGIHSAAAGAAASFAIAEGTSMIGAFVLLGVNPLTGEAVGRLFRAVLATLAMAGVMWLARNLFFVIEGALGMIVFGVMAWKLQVLGQEDQQKLVAMLAKRFALLRRARS